jgi:RNA-splicing ligase RtcB
MIELNGKYTNAFIYTDNIESEAISQLINLCNQEFIKDSKIRIMPDCHVGKGCTIGTTITIQDKIVPNLVGVDIGCGMLTVELGNIDLNLINVDNFIRNNIPSGFNINKESKFNYKDNIENLKCFRDIPKSSNEYNKAIGTLGGGNHFIEINIDNNQNKYLVIHSGSRNLGNQIARYYQDKAIDYHSGLDYNYETTRETIIKTYKDQGKRKEIKNALELLKKEYVRKECSIQKDLCYLEGILKDNYLYDMNIAQKFANKNREIIAFRIIEECIRLKFNKLNKFQTIHNYIDLQNNILRKGAISAQKDEKVLIPINMRDGSIVAIGKGNPEWNYSAPHGAGRIMSRNKAKETFLLEDFQNSMKDIYTTSVNKSTLDECPMAYKSIEDIINNIQDTVEIIDIIKPIYNFKSS